MNEGQGWLIILLLAGILVVLWPAVLEWAAWGIGILIVVGIFRALFGVGRPRLYTDREWEERKRR